MAIEGGSKPRKRAIKEGKMATKTVFAMPTRQTAKNRIAFTIVPVINWLLGAWARREGKRMAAKVKRKVQARSLVWNVARGKVVIAVC